MLKMILGVLEIDYWNQSLNLELEVLRLFESWDNNKEKIYNFFKVLKISNY